MHVIPYPVPAVGFVSKPSPNNTWTWVQRLGNLLAAAELFAGPRDMSWTILGVEFGETVPMIWYPNCYPRAVIIRLSVGMLNNPAGAFSELAHEVVHLLAPTGEASASNFEEGLATMFSEDQCAALSIPPAPTIPSYEAAADAVRRVIAFAPQGVKSARETMPNFGSWTKETISKYFPGAAQADLDFLCAKFVR